MRIRFLMSAVFAMLSVPLLYGHIRIYPTESTQGVREKYTMRVPNEKQVPCVRIEGEFPPELEVNRFEFKPGWKIEIKRDDKGKILGAIWTGTMVADEFVEFGMQAINPKDATSLVWKFVQYFADGSKAEFTGPADSPSPSPVVTLKKASAPVSAQ